MMNGYSYGLGGLFMILFWVFVVALVVWLVLTLSRSQVHGDDGPTGALSILERRLAQGEIDAEEFRLRRAAIREAKL